MLAIDPYEDEDLPPILPKLGVGGSRGLQRSPLQPPRKRLIPGTARVGDHGQQGEGWRNVLLDQLRQRGANFYGV